MFAKRIVEEGFRKGFKGNWGAEEHTKRLGLVQDLNRLSFFSALCQLRKTNLPIAAVRAFLEISVVVIGWYLGGTVGIGTLLFAFGIGPAVALGLFLVGKIFNN